MTKLNKKLLTAITAAIPKNDVRWFFNGLFIDYDRKYMAATDGHCLGDYRSLKTVGAPAGYPAPQ